MELSTWREAGERAPAEALGELGVLELVRGHIADERVGTLLGELRREQPHAAGGRREAALGEARDAGNRHAQRALVAQAART